MCVLEVEERDSFLSGMQRKVIVFVFKQLFADIWPCMTSVNFTYGGISG